MGDLWTYVITTLLAAFAAALTQVLNARFSKSPEEKEIELKEKEVSLQERATKVAKEALELSGMSAAQLAQALQQSGQMRAEIDELRGKLSERDELSKERDRRHEELAQMYSDLEAEMISLKHKQVRDLEETQRLRNDYANAQKQIIKLEDLVIGAGEYIETMTSALKAANIEIEENKDLMESVLRLKLERTHRGKRL